MNRKIVFYLIFILLVSLKLACTEQTPDVMIYHGDYFYLNCNPIDSLFVANPDKRPGAPGTALWRGYVATLEVVDTSLIIKDIETINLDYDMNVAARTYKSIKSTVLAGEDSLNAFPYSGLVVLRKDNYPYHQPKKQKDEWCYILEFHKGNLVKEVQFKNSMFETIKKDQISAYKETAEYRNERHKMIKEYGFSRSLTNCIIERDIFVLTKKILF